MTNQSQSVAVPCLFTTVTRDDDVPVPGADPGVTARNQICVTGVAGEPIEIRRQRQSVAFGDPASAADVLAGALLVVRASGRFGLLVEDRDPLAGELPIGSHRPGIGEPAR